MFLRMTCLALFLMLADTAHAQQFSEAFNRHMSAASQADQSGNMDGATEEAEAALATAANGQERAIALHFLALTAFNAGDWAEAESRAGDAAAIVRAEAPDSVEALTTLLAIMGNAALQQGADDRYQAYALEAAALNQSDSDLYWTFGESEVIHRFSGYACPTMTDFGLISEPITFLNTGLDVGCRYSVNNSPDTVVIMHAYYTPSVDAETAFADASASVQQVFRDARVIENGETEHGGYPVTYDIYGLSDRQSGVWTSVEGDWTIKLRLTHFGDLSRDTIRNIARQTFRNAAGMREHFSTCTALSGVENLREGDIEGGINTTLMTAAMISDISGTFSPTPDTMTCFVGLPSGPGDNIVYAEIDSEGGLVRMLARATSGRGDFISAVPNPGLAVITQAAGRQFDGIPYLVAHHTGRSDTYYGIFSDAPSPTAFLEIVNDISGDTLPALMRRAVNEDGETNIEIMTMDGAALLEE